MGNRFDEIERQLSHIQQRLANVERKLNIEVSPPPLPPEFTQIPPPAVSPQRTAADIAASIADQRNDVDVLAATVESQRQPSVAPVGAIPPLVAPATIASPKPPKTPTSPAKPSITLEQVLGKRGLMIAGIGIFLFGAIFFFKFAIDQGWINPLLRVITGAVAGVAMLGLGEWSLRRGMRQFAAGLIGAGVVLLYIITFIASPNGLYSYMLSSEAAFALMSLVTIVAAAMSLRANMQFAVIVGVIGALATPVLLSTGENRQAVLMTYMLIVEADFLAIALFKQWRIVPALVLAGVLALYGGWFAKYYSPSAAGMTFGTAWTMLAIFWAYGMAGMRCGAISRGMAAVLMTVALAAMGLLNIIACDQPAMLNLFCIQCLALFVVAQGTAMWARWFVPLPIITLFVGLMAWAGFDRIPADAAINSWFCVYGWLFVAAGAVPLMVKTEDRVIDIPCKLTFMLTAVIFAIVLRFSPALSLHEFFAQMVVLSAVICVAATWRKSPTMLPVMALATIWLIATWCLRHDISAGAGAVCMYEWLFLLALVMPAVKLSDITGRSAMNWCVAIVTIAMSLGFMYVGDDAICTYGDVTPVETYHFYVVQLLVANGAALAFYWWRNANWVRLMNLSLTAIGLLMLADHANKEIFSQSGSIVFALWIWAFLAMFTGDILSRAKFKATDYSTKCDCVITSIIAGAAFLATYITLKVNFLYSMGVYTAAMGAMFCVLAWLTGWKWQRRALGYAYLSQGLVLLTLAVPIQFDRYAITLAWTCAGAVAMFIYRRLGNPLLLAKSLAVLALAAMHLLIFAIPHDPLMKQAMLTAGGVAVPYGLILGVAVIAGMFIAATILGYRNATMSDNLKAIRVALAAAGATLYMYLSVSMLPVGASQWWWMTLLGGFLAVLYFTRSKGVAAGATIIAAACLAKYLYLDTFSAWLLSTCLNKNANLNTMAALNWTFAASVVLTAAIYLLRRMWAKLSDKSGITIILSLLAALPILWAGSFEIDRYFVAHAASLADAGQAMQMTLSIWWGVYATALLVIGFASGNSPVRYFSLAIFAATIVKVLIFDMRNVQTAYRILTFVALGVLLMAASWLYNRYFRTEKDKKAA